MAIVPTLHVYYCTETHNYHTMRCDNFFKEEKQKALFRAYKNARKALYNSGIPSNMIHKEAIRMAINTPQDRFWITPYRVYRLLIDVVNKKRDHMTYGTRKEMYRQIVDTYYKIRGKRIFSGRPLIYIAQFVAYEPSQGFYMSESRAGRMIAQEFRRRRTQQ